MFVIKDKQRDELFKVLHKNLYIEFNHLLSCWQYINCFIENALDAKYHNTFILTFKKEYLCKREEVLNGQVYLRNQEGVIMFRFCIGTIFFIVYPCMFFLGCYVYKYHYRALINKQIILHHGGVINIKTVEKKEFLYLKRGSQEELVTGFMNGIIYQYVITEQAYYVFSYITKENRKYDNLQCIEKKHTKKFYAIVD